MAKQIDTELTGSQAAKLALAVHRLRDWLADFETLNLSGSHALWDSWHNVSSAEAKIARALEDFAAETNGLQPIGFTAQATAELRLIIERVTGRDVTECTVTDYFNEISYFQPDGSARIEISSTATLTGVAEVIDLYKDDFIYC